MISASHGHSLLVCRAPLRAVAEQAVGVLPDISVAPSPSAEWTFVELEDPTPGLDQAQATRRLTRLASWPVIVATTSETRSSISLWSRGAQVAQHGWDDVGSAIPSAGQAAELATALADATGCPEAVLIATLRGGLPARPALNALMKVIGAPLPDEFFAPLGGSVIREVPGGYVIPRASALEATRAVAGEGPQVVVDRTLRSTRWLVGRSLLTAACAASSVYAWLPDGPSSLRAGFLTLATVAIYPKPLLL